MLTEHVTPPAISMTHTNFIGQRADKLTVKDVGNDVEAIELENGITKNGVVKEVEHYTVTCGECGVDGYYEKHTEIVCPLCGLVLSERPAVLQTEYGHEDEPPRFGKDQRRTKSRSSKRGTHEPSSGGY